MSDSAVLEQEDSRTELDPNRSRKGLSKLLDAERVIHKRIKDNKGTDSELSKLACAPVQLRGSIRTEQMKPDPKPIEVEVVEERRQHRIERGPVEP